MYQLVEQLRQSKVRVAMLSNIDERLATFLRKWKLYEPFDPCLLSYEIGIEKPDPKAFELLLQRLNLPAKDVVFIDDKPENVEAANQLGIHAILFESSEQIRQELTKKELFPAGVT
jgi:putative hydrolase of the HAD superfamily